MSYSWAKPDLRNSMDRQAAKPAISRGHAKRSALQAVLRFYPFNIKDFPAIHAQRQPLLGANCESRLTGGKKYTRGDRDVGNIFPVTGVLMVWFIQDTV